MACTLRRSVLGYGKGYDRVRVEFWPYKLFVFLVLLLSLCSNFRIFSSAFDSELPFFHTKELERVDIILEGGPGSITDELNDEDGVLKRILSGIRVCCHI